MPYQGDAASYPLHAAAMEGRLVALAAGLKAKHAGGTLAAGTPCRAPPCNSPCLSLTAAGQTACLHGGRALASP